MNRGPGTHQKGDWIGVDGVEKEPVAIVGNLILIPLPSSPYPVFI
jgi:hypothetical protein